jgi:hypothetical protein
LYAVAGVIGNDIFLTEVHFSDEWAMPVNLIVVYTILGA